MPGMFAEPRKGCCRAGHRKKIINSTSLGRSKIPILLSNLAFYAMRLLCRILMLDSGEKVDD